MASSFLRGGPRGIILLTVTVHHVRPFSCAEGFSQAFLAVCLFGCGTSPLFIMLILRDILGIDGKAQAQQHTEEILFFVVQRGRRCWAPWAAPRDPENTTLHVAGRSWDHHLLRSGRLVDAPVEFSRSARGCCLSRRGRDNAFIVSLTPANV